MKIKVLGCSGAELPNFNPPAFLLDDRILLDAGTTGGSLNEKAQEKISHILITHAHLDHIRGIPTFADNMLLRNSKHNIVIISIKEVIQAIKRNLFNNTIWPDFTRIPSPKKPVLTMKTIKPGESFKIHNYKIIAEKVNHTVNAVGYIIKESNGKKLLYTGDTGATVNLWKRANMESRSGIDGAIVEVTFPNSLKKSAVITKHLTPAMVFDELKKLKQFPKNIFITHTKPQFINAISRELRNLKVKNLVILKEGKTYKI